MASIVALSTLAFMVVGTVVGVRLLRLALRTGERPEWLMGLGLLGMTGLSFPIAVLLQTDLLAAPIAVVAQGFALAIFAASGVCIAAFTREVFRPSQRPALALFALIALGWAGFVCSGWWGLWSTRELLPSTGHRVLIRHGLMGVGFVWTAFEAFLFHGQLQRRMRLGLADPVVANRVLFWSIAATGAVLSNVSMVVVSALGENPMSHPFSRIFASIGGMTASVALLMAFLPPRRIRERIEASRARSA